MEPTKCANVNILLHFAKMSLDAYEYSASSVSFGSGDCCCFNIEDHTITLCFKGSKTVEQWILNLMSPLALIYGVNSLGVKYLEDNLNLSCARALVDKVLLQFKISKSELNGVCFILCGHSRGGLFAAVAALYLTKLGAVVKNVYTFGAPKLYAGLNADVSEVDKIRPVLINVIHRLDMVPCCLDSLAQKLSLGQCLSDYNIVQLIEEPLPYQSVASDNVLYTMMCHTTNPHDMNNSYLNGLRQLCERGEYVKLPITLVPILH